MYKRKAQEIEAPNDDEVHVYEKGDEPLVDSQSVAASKTPVGSSPSLNEIESFMEDSSLKKSLTSDVWKEMTRITIDRVVKAVCNYCNKKLNGSSSAGTSHLRNHLTRCRKTKIRDVGQLLLQTGEKKKDGKVEYSAFPFDQAKSRRDLADMIVLHEYPLSIVDHHGFRKFLNNLQPLFEMITRNTIKSDIMKIYHSKREKLFKELEILNSRVAITTYMWTAKPTKKGFMAITAHYIDSSWVLQNRIVRFIYIPPPHSSDVLMEFLVEALMELNLDRKLLTITVNNSSSNDAMLDKMVDRLDPSTLMLRGKVVHMQCCAHILNLIVKDGLEVIKKEVKNVRNSVVYWLGSHSRIQKFEDAARQLSIKDINSLVLDCPTRWNSTYIMLETALKYRLVFPRLKLKERSYTCLPDEEDWTKVERIAEKLKKFYDVTLIFLETSYPTSNEFFSTCL